MLPSRFTLVAHAKCWSIDMYHWYCRDGTFLAISVKLKVMNGLSCWCLPLITSCITFCCMLLPSSCMVGNNVKEMVHWKLYRKHVLLVLVVGRTKKTTKFFFQIQYNFPIGLFFNSRTGQRLFVDFLSFTFGTAKRGKCFSNTTKFLFKYLHNSTLPFNCFIWVSREDCGNGVQKKSCHSFRTYFQNETLWRIFYKQSIKLNLGNSKHLF